RPRYDRGRMSAGVVHFGPGAFFRAHQASYFERLVAQRPDWAICAVALQSSGVRDALAPQDDLYTLAVLDETQSFQVIGALRELLVAPQSPAIVLERLSAPTTRLVTATVTEKGYYLAGDGTLDLEQSAIRADLQAPQAPRTLIGVLAEGLRRRRAAGLAPFTVVSCDNLVDNGRRLGRAVARYAHELDCNLAAWIAGEVSFPRTMVDSITPATDDALRTRVADALGGIHDRWPVQREAFVQWVVEDGHGGGDIPWDAAGITLTNDITGWDRAKLRLLNGAHSSLAYLGLLAGYETVSQAMSDRDLSAFARTLMLEDVLPTLDSPEGLDPLHYVEDILARFRNRAIRHPLAQIAWDGSQKLPFRLLGTIGDRLAAGAPIDRLCVSIASWLHFLRQRAHQRIPIVDPLAERLAAIGRECSGETSDVPRFLGLEGVFPATLAANPRFRTTLRDAYGRLSVPPEQIPARVRESLAGTLVEAG
ncbi:MAG TPA: mannitol dehydrogenase family protein, partial [Steroidobacteraceae bacterium]|nr:mannitol dehydrogenase family protein [Steroidobacteraceae bacterium]